MQVLRDTYGYNFRDLVTFKYSAYNTYGWSVQYSPVNTVGATIRVQPVAVSTISVNATMTST